MTRLHESATLGVAVLAGLLAGCRDSSTQPPGPVGPVDVSTVELPLLGPVMGPLDDGRLEIAPPKGWAVPPRTDRWLVRFTRTEDAPYPSIQLAAEDSEGIVDATEANVGVLAEQIAAGYGDEGAAARQAMAFSPTTVGQLVGVCYRRRGKAPLGPKQIIVDRLFFDTVVAGRRYTFELRTRDGEIERYRSYLFAVVGGVRFVEGTVDAEPPTTNEPTNESLPDGN